MGIRRTYSPWVTVPPGTIGDLRNRPPHQPYNRCARHMGYEMHPIARQTDAPDHLKEIDRFQIRIVDSALRHGSVGTIPESSVSTVDSLDTCRPAVHDRTRPYRSNLWVGNSNMIIINNGMAITNRETPHRPGPHPHRSTHASFEPHVIIMHHIKFILLTIFSHTYLYLPLFTYIWLYLGFITLIWAYLPLIALMLPNMPLFY